MMSTSTTGRSNWLMRSAVSIGLLAVLYVPFIAKPVHVDDANFLMLAEGAARDPWRPHNHLINWDGETKPAFDILANPPGIAYYLLPVRQAPEWVMHIWMCPWLLLGAWGCWRLSTEYAPKSPFLATVYLLTCPVVVLSAHALTPDLPVFACFSAGLGGFVTTRRCRWSFAILAGCAAIFRYSGVTAIPLLVAIGFLRWGWRGALSGLCAALPISLLILHDWHAYQEIHLFAMTAAQNDVHERPWWRAVHNVVAGIAMLGGAGVLPLIVWRRESLAGALIGIGIGIDVAYLANLTLAQSLAAIGFIAAGAASLSLALAPGVRHWDLGLWGLGGASFFYCVRFAAVRYWAAFLPGVALLAIRQSAGRTGLLTCGITVNVMVSCGMAIDDQEFARCYRDAALSVAQRYPVGSFSGHWGWQHYLHRAGWKPIERGGTTAEYHAVAVFSDVQYPASTTCLQIIERWRIEDHWWGPRVFSLHDHASYHSGGYGSYAPWTFSDEPYDVIVVYRRCDRVVMPTVAGGRDE